MVNHLDKAYGYIESGNLQLAIGILETLVNADPMNVEAWEAYMQICGTYDELDSLCEQMLQHPEINLTDRESILDYYYFLRQKMRSRGDGYESQKMITLELVDQFNYTLIDRSFISQSNKDDPNLEYGFVGFLGKAIIVPYVVLLVIGLNLLFIGNNFGYWILIVLAISIIVRMWNIIFPVAKVTRKVSVRQRNPSSKLSDELSYRQGLIR